jgi:hypothetical protein
MDRYWPVTSMLDAKKISADFKLAIFAIMILIKISINDVSKFFKRFFISIVLMIDD